MTNKSQSRKSQPPVYFDPTCGSGAALVTIKCGAVFELPPFDATAHADIFATQLRAAIDDLGLPAYVVAKRAGVAQAALSTFMRGGDLRLSTASRIAAFLGFTMVQDKGKLPRRLAAIRENREGKSSRSSARCMNSNLERKRG